MGGVSSVSLSIAGQPIFNVEYRDPVPDVTVTGMLVAGNQALVLLGNPDHNWLIKDKHGKRLDPATTGAIYT